MDIDNNNLEKNNKTFVDEILNELSELDFSKIKNLMVVSLGVISPVVPLIFLYRRDLLKELELVGALILALTINSILIMFNTIIYKIKERKDVELVLIKTQIMSEKDKDIIICSELLSNPDDKKMILEFLRGDNDLNKNNELSEKLERIRGLLNFENGIIINEEEICIEGINRKRALGENIERMNKRVEEIQNKKSYEAESFEMAFLLNISIGLIVILAKVFSYLIFNISLKALLIGIIIGYCVGIFKIIKLNLQLKYNKFNLGRIRR